MTPLENSLGYVFDRPELLSQALTHKSFANEQEKSGTGDNERFEFLGDAVLDLSLSEILMRRFPFDSEGALSKKRASLVNEDTLAQIAGELNLGTLIRLGKGESKTGGVQKPRILASGLEAVFGAIHLDRGFAEAVLTIERVFETRLTSLMTGGPDFQLDFKTRLQEKAQEILRATPTYFVEKSDGPDHDKIFEVSVRIENRTIAVGRGRSKKAAEQDAARQALDLEMPAEAPVEKKEC